MEKENGGDLTCLGGECQLVLQSFHRTAPGGHKTTKGNFILPLWSNVVLFL